MNHILSFHILCRMAILLAASTIWLHSYAQFDLAFEDVLSDPNQANPNFICLDEFGTKRLKFVQSEQNLYVYHLNNTIYKVISMPVSSTVTRGSIWYVSNTLFDTNSSTIEYTLNLIDSQNNMSTRVYREDGMLIMHFSDAVFQYPSVAISNADPYQNSYPILNTDSGTLMRLSVISNNQIVKHKYYKLLGKLKQCDCPIDDGGEVSGISGTPLRPAGDLIFPNPVFSGQKVTYRMGQDYAHGKLMFFDNSGKKVHHVTLSDSETDIFLERTIFPAGSYYYQFYSENEAIGAKQLIVVN